MYFAQTLYLTFVCLLNLVLNYCLVCLIILFVCVYVLQVSPLFMSFPWDKESIHLQYIFPISGLTVDLNILQVQQSAVFESKQLV